jgi:hypothetical protein
MKIKTHVTADLMLPELRQQLERQLYIALHKFSRHIGHVELTLRDVNGPRGGRDKQGQVVVHFRRGTPLVVRAAGENAQTLAAQLAAVARRAVKSRIRRRRTWAIRRLRRRLRNQPLPAWSDKEQPTETQAA